MRCADCGVKLETDRSQHVTIWADTPEGVALKFFCLSCAEKMEVTVEAHSGPSQRHAEEEEPPSDEPGRAEPEAQGRRGPD